MENLRWKKTRVKGTAVKKERSEEVEQRTLGKSCELSRMIMRYRIILNYAIPRNPELCDIRAIVHFELHDYAMPHNPGAFLTYKMEQ